MERALVRDHARASGVEPRELHRVLDRLGARVEEGRPRLAGDRGERAEPLGELDRRLVRDDREVRVQEARRLLRHRLDDPRMGVAGVDHADAAREVDEDVAVDVRDRRVLGALREDRQVDDERVRDRPLLPLEERPRARPGDLRANLDRPRRGHLSQRSRRCREYIRPMDTWIAALDPDPLVELRRWLEEAREAGLHEPEAMALATATPAGTPSVRMVLLRGLDERGLSLLHELREPQGGGARGEPRRSRRPQLGPAPAAAGPGRGTGRAA